MNLKLIALILATLNGLCICSAPSPLGIKKDEDTQLKYMIESLKQFSYLVEFNKDGWRTVYMYFPKSNLKTDLDFKNPASRFLFQMKIDQALEAASRMGTYTVSNQFVIEPNGEVTLKLLPCLLYKPLRASFIKFGKK